MTSFTGAAELTFADNEHLLVEADRVLVAMSDRGVGALSISHGGRPNVVDLVAAMEAGPFTLTYHGGMMSCQLLNFACRESEGRTGSWSSSSKPPSASRVEHRQEARGDRAQVHGVERVPPLAPAALDVDEIGGHEPLQVARRRRP
jgi:hypothetical protein